MGNVAITEIPGNFGWQKFFLNLASPPKDSVNLTREEFDRYVKDLMDRQPDDFREFVDALADRIFQVP